MENQLDKSPIAVPAPDAKPHKVKWQKRPQIAYCPSCRSENLTSVNYQPGLCTWVLCSSCFCFGCIFGCCLIPFCTQSTQDCLHYCSQCNNFIAKKSPCC